MRKKIIYLFVISLSILLLGCNREIPRGTSIPDTNTKETSKDTDMPVTNVKEASRDTDMPVTNVKETSIDTDISNTNNKEASKEEGNEIIETQSPTEEDSQNIETKTKESDSLRIYFEEYSISYDTEIGENIIREFLTSTQTFLSALSDFESGEAIFELIQWNMYESALLETDQYDIYMQVISDAKNLSLTAEETDALHAIEFGFGSICVSNMYYNKLSNLNVKFDKNEYFIYDVIRLMYRFNKTESLEYKEELLYVFKENTPLFLLSLYSIMDRKDSVLTMLCSEISTANSMGDTSYMDVINKTDELIFNESEIEGEMLDAIKAGID